MEDSVCFPKRMFNKSFAIGMDIGGSCWKLAYTTEEGENLRFHFAIFSKLQHSEVLEFLKNVSKDQLQPDTDVTTCGLAVNAMNEDIQRTLRIRLNNTSEMILMADAFRFLHTNLDWDNFIRNPSQDALDLGVQRAKRSAGVCESFYETHQPRMCKPDQLLFDIPDRLDAPPTGMKFPVFLNVVGSSSFPLLVHENGAICFHTWNPCSGKAFLALSNYITSIESFDELLSMAESGDGSKVDQKLASLGTNSSDEFYAALQSSGSSDITGHSFGHLVGRSKDEFQQKDLLSALLSNNIDCSVRELCLWAALYDIKQVFFCGSFVGASDSMRDRVTSDYVQATYGSGRGHRSHHYFVRHGTYLGAIGSLLCNLEVINDSN